MGLRCVAWRGVALGRKGELRYSVAEERRADHVPAVQPYPVEEVMLDLLHTAAAALRWYATAP